MVGSLILGPELRSLSWIIVDHDSGQTLGASVVGTATDITVSPCARMGLAMSCVGECLSRKQKVCETNGDGSRQVHSRQCDGARVRQQHRKISAYSSDSMLRRCIGERPTEPTKKKSGNWADVENTGRVWQGVNVNEIKLVNGSVRRPWFDVVEFVSLRLVDGTLQGMSFSCHTLRDV